MFTKLSFAVACILAGSTLYASSATSASLKYGLTSIENDNGWKLKNNTFGVDARFDIGSIVQPRIDLNYVKIDDKSKWGGVSALIQGALSLQAGTSFSALHFPHEVYIYGGAGYEYVQDSTSVFDSQPFVQGGLGATFGINKHLSLLTEFRALQVIDSSGNHNDEDNEFTFFVGLNFPLTKEAPKPAPIQKREISKPAPVIVPKPQPVVTILDSDHDGVADAQDECPDTIVKEDTEVSERGCEVVTVKDSDYDMVADSADQCPNTPEGTKVDSTGCAVLMNLDIHFDTDSDKIKADSMDKIKLFARYVRELPQGSIVTIVGHTDNVGNEKYNHKLSYKRAVAVRKAILAQGNIDWHMIKAQGKGSTQPVADNSTSEGRAQNRRIEASITHPGGKS